MSSRSTFELFEVSAIQGPKLIDAAPLAMHRDGQMWRLSRSSSFLSLIKWSTSVWISVLITRLSWFSFMFFVGLSQALKAFEVWLRSVGWCLQHPGALLSRSPSLGCWRLITTSFFRIFWGFEVKRWKSYLSTLYHIDLCGLIYFLFFCAPLYEFLKRFQPRQHQHRSGQVLSLSSKRWAQRLH